MPVPGGFLADAWVDSLTVRVSKTDAGQRMIPITDAASEVILRLRERAKGFNGIEKHHYIFPACEHGHVDPTRHQKSFRTAWRNLTRAIQCPACGRLQQPANKCADEKCRAKIQGIKSQLAESQVSDQTIMASHRWPREPKDVGPLFACAERGEAASCGRTLGKADRKLVHGERKHRLRHKRRHKTGCR